MDAQRFPLDFEQLKRGDYLNPELVEAAAQCSRFDKAFRLKVLRLREMIRAHFLAKGDLVTVVSERDGLRILTHSEQADYAPEREERAISQMLLARAEGIAVDLQQLSDEQRQRHERWNQRIGWRTQQLMKPPPPELMP